MKKLTDEKVLEILVDFANAVEAAAVNVKHRVAEITGVKGAVAVREETLNPDAIKWQLQPGLNNPKGPFEKSEDFNNPNHKSLVKKLTENKGFLRLKGFQYWLYENGSTIGRRAMKRK